MSETLPLTPVQCRVLGCLVEKEKATPQNYPLTRNSLRLACNQSTNRSPVVDYLDDDLDVALQAMRESGLIRNVYSTSNRATKYRHVLDEAWGLDDRQQAVLAVLLLRGAQTVGEVKGRTERLAEFRDLNDVDDVLGSLAERPEPLVRLLERQPGQKDARWVHLVGGDELATELGDAVSPSGFASAATGSNGAAALVGDRVTALEDEVARLRSDLEELRGELQAFRSEFT